MEKLYKVLKKGRSFYGGNLAWSLPKKGPGDWHEIIGDLEICRNGIHLTNEPSSWFIWDCDIYEAEYEGEIIWDRKQNKCVVRKARLLQLVKPPEWWMLVHRFVEKDIPSVKLFKPDNKPLENWKLYKGKTWAAARIAAWDAAEAATEVAARDAAWTAAWDVICDATLMAKIKVVSDLNIDRKYIEHAEARWQVWEKGYGLTCDVNGVLYVYAKED